MSVTQLVSTRIRSLRNVFLPISLAVVLSTPVLTFQTTAQANSLVASSSNEVTWPAGIPNYSGCAMASLYNFQLADVPSLISPSSGCYELRLDDRFISLQKGWSLQQAIADLEQQKISHPHAQIEGYFDGFKIGYELYWDGVRVGYEPSWTLQDAIANLEQNKASYPDKKIEGHFYGFTIGYELYWDDVRVGYEPIWTREQALENLRQNQQAYPGKAVRGTYNGSSL
ncbi:MAG TPA: hypothetical protein V6C78_13955 [Crinalium sp.]|jgi:hypothetical protein